MLALTPEETASRMELKREERDIHKILVHYYDRRISFLEKLQAKTEEDLQHDRDSMQKASAVLETLQDEVNDRRESHGRRMALNAEMAGESDEESLDPRVAASSQVDPREAHYRMVARPKRR